ncbi:MAG: phosphoribosyltransferase [Bacteroidia bacterium]|nr:phosphoribosyltransferase [Bacteroidia bacterium]MCZ2247650.1 phosphoribosyltransferase [Bacteroidia bacterium]
MESTLLLNHTQIQQIINRMAYQLYENHYAEDEIVLAGIQQRGYIFAQKIVETFARFSNQKIKLLPLEVEKDTPYDSVHQAMIDKSLFENKVVVIVDDVLYSGKTLTYAMSRFLHAPVKKLSTMVLVDRNHKNYPVNADYVGFSLATTLKQHIKVMFNNNENKVLLE